MLCVMRPPLYHGVVVHGHTVGLKAAGKHTTSSQAGLVATTPNTTYSRVHFTADVHVRTTGIRFENCEFDSYVITDGSPSSWGFEIVDSDIHGDHTKTNGSVRQRDMVLTRVRIYDVVEGVHTNYQSTLTNCEVFGMVNPGGSHHADLIQDEGSIAGGSGENVIGCRLSGWRTDGSKSNACVFYNDTPTNKVITVRDSWMSGSNGYLAYFTDAVAGSGLTYDVQGNRFEVGSYVVGTHATTGSLSGAFTWVDNALSNGTTVGL